MWEPSQKDDGAHEHLTSCYGNWVCGTSLTASRWNWYGYPLGPIGLMHHGGTNRSKVGMHRCRGFRLHRPLSSRQPTPSRSWTCSVNRCRRRHRQRQNIFRSLNPAVPSNAKTRNMPTMRRDIYAGDQGGPCVRSLGSTAGKCVQRTKSTCLCITTNAEERRVEQRIQMYCDCLVRTSKRH